MHTLGCSSIPDISTAPVLCKKATVQVFHGIPVGGVYFILVTDRTHTEHEANLHQVLQIWLRRNKAKILMCACSFRKKGRRSKGFQCIYQQNPVVYTKTCVDQSHRVIFTFASFCILSSYLTNVEQHLDECSIRIYMTSSIKSYKVSREVHAPSVNPSLRDECKFLCYYSEVVLSLTRFVLPN